MNNTDSSQMKSILIGGRTETFDRPKVMGIVNITPDSFYGGSRTADRVAAEQRIAGMVSEGVDWLDIGGYSTRPGAEEVDADEEMRRLAIGLDAARKAAPGIPLSVDTFRADIARRCVEQWGVDIINDISGGTMDPAMWETVAELRCAYVLMHMRGTPATMQTLTDYGDVTAEVLEDLARKAETLRLMGVADIIIDPGFGFAKTVDDNYRLLSELQHFNTLGMPLLAGLSRKSMIWRPLGITPAESLPGTAALNAVALMKGADILRVHDVKETVQTVRLIQLLRQNTPHS